MKNFKMRLFLILLPVIFVVQLVGQGSLVDLYIEPDVKSKQVGRVALDDAQLGQATPVMEEAKALLGWHFADFSGEVDGYVADAKIGKDLLPVDNALIFSEPTHKSTVLGVFNYGDAVEILDTGMWWKIRINKAFPVYFVLDSPPPLPPVTGVAEEPAVEPAMEPVVEVTEAALIEEPAPVFTGRNVTRIPAATSPQPTSQVQSQSGLPQPGVMGQSYEGLFKPSKRKFGLLKPKADYYLEGADGKRIAWVKTDEIVIPGSLHNFLNEPVIVYGERSKISASSRDWIINARNMRLK